MLPIRSACLEEGNSDANLNAGILSETEVHLLNFKEEFRIYFLGISNSLFPLFKSAFIFDVGAPEIVDE
jgi:hypothetical protein